MAKFEYTYCTFPHGSTVEKVIDKLNSLGNEGWEVCASEKNAGSSGGIIMFFKRKLEDQKRKKKGA